MSDHTPGPEPGSEPDPTIDPPKDASTGDVAPGLGAVAGDAVGPFKIIRTLGEGGFGVVYLAEQTAPVKRRVALKVIKPGMDTKSVIARFEAERQALAMMDFRGIAKVFEAGLELQRRELNAASLARALVLYPLMTAQVVAGIYWQAFRLWSKGTPFYAHPKRDDGQMEMAR